ncbi:unnamed protein product [Mytilus edulis]|uniref:Uncharacterized protein n=1 Tax=Mytilus edulis TaxID=6550 RepID=A0A8S3QH78_MYTED|nr:unnamed protein product [Mytilus edulis]
MNQNTSWKQSADNRSVDFDALSVVPKLTDKVNDDVINIPHSNKKGPTSNNSQCTSNDQPNNTDINNSTKDSYKNLSKRKKVLYSKNESGKRPHRSRSHSTDSKKRKKIDSSTNGVCQKFDKDWANKVTYQNNKSRDGVHSYSVERRKKSFLARNVTCRFEGSKRCEYQIRSQEKVNHSSSFVKGMGSSRCTANRDRSPFRRTIHHSLWKNEDIHISSRRHFDNRNKTNATVDRRYRSNVHKYNEYDRNRTHAIDSRHEHLRHELFSRIAKNASSTTIKNDETNGDTLNLNQRKEHKGRQESRSDILIVPCTKQYKCYNKNIPEKSLNGFLRLIIR